MLRVAGLIVVVLTTAASAQSIDAKSAFKEISRAYAIGAQSLEACQQSAEATKSELEKIKLELEKLKSEARPN